MTAKDSSVLLSTPMRAWCIGVVLLIPIAVNAQGRKDVEFPAAVVVEDACLMSGAATAKEGTDVVGESGGSLVRGFVAGLTGDLVTAGINALGAALEEASREKGFSANGASSFNFYTVRVQKDLGVDAVTVKPSFRSNQSKCVVLSYGAPAAEVTEKERDLEAVDPMYVALKEKLIATNLPPDPDIYIEAELQRRADGFIVRPTFVWYRRALPRAPKKQAPTEIHFTFSTPTKPGAEAQAVFALARIRLPPLSPGQKLVAADLKGFASEVVPNRPVDGSVEATRLSFVSAQTAYATNVSDKRKAIRSLSSAKILASQKNATAEQKSKIEALESQIEELKESQKDIKTRWDAAKKIVGVNTGSTNVAVRFVVVRDANQFGLAVASALKSRAKSAGDAVATELGPKTPEPAWSDAHSEYVTTMTAVEGAERALSAAKNGGDEDAIFNAEVELKKAKATANAAAVKAKLPIPFNTIL